MTETENGGSFDGSLPWQQDVEMISRFLDRKAELEDEHAQYVTEHPEMSAILKDFVQAVLIHKPDDVFQFAYDYFAPFSSGKGLFQLALGPASQQFARTDQVGRKTPALINYSMAAHSVLVPGIVCQEAVEIPSRVFVGNLPYDITDLELQAFFEAYGNVKDAKVVRDRREVPRGFGFVTFASEEDAQAVLELGTIVYKDKKKLNISKAIRRQGGQYRKPNKEFVNAKRVQIWDSPHGEYILTREGMQPFNSAQPSKPCLQYVSPAVLIQPHQQHPYGAPLAPHPMKVTGPMSPCDTFFAQASHTGGNMPISNCPATDNQVLYGSPFTGFYPLPY